MFTLPSKQGYTIYTKLHCSYCIKAKILLENLSPCIIDCDDYLADVIKRDFFLTFIEDLAGKPHTTFPIVFRDGQYLGGYTETKQLFEKENAFSEIDKI
jgi:hypothetical protein